MRTSTDRGAITNNVLSKVAMAFRAEAALLRSYAIKPVLNDRGTNGGHQTDTHPDPPPLVKQWILFGKGKRKKAENFKKIL